jgi:outer membrane receptor protein involved in Fe transport
VKLTYLNTVSIATLLLFAGAAHAETFNIPSGDLKSALDAYARQTGVNLIVAGAEVNGVQTGGAQGDFSTDGALSRLLSGTGFSMHRRSSGAIGIMRDQSSSLEPVSETPIQLAQASALSRPSVETVTVTSSKLGGADVQSVPIAISAFSQEQLTATQTAGGPDLVKQVPNLTFSKTNFTGYNIQIRGIGTQAVSVTTDPAVAVSFNDVPFIRNHFFEQEFFDVSQVEVLRGPQGTLYGRNATSGVVNLISAKPTDRYEAMASVDVGNYNNRRLEGMLNIPVLDDKIDLRVAGEWTKRDGYAFNEQTGSAIDGRDLWSGRVSLLLRPLPNLTGTFIYEHFQEDDDRARSTKQLCAKDESPTVVDGPAGPREITGLDIFWLEQGCRPVSLYSPESFQTPNAGAIPFIALLYSFTPYIPGYTDPYAGETQSRDLRVISSLIDPKYRARNNTFEFNLDYRRRPNSPSRRKPPTTTTLLFRARTTTASTRHPAFSSIRAATARLSGRMANSAIRNSAARHASSRKICRRKQRSNSIRNCVWLRALRGRSISWRAPITFIIRRWKTITSSPTP